jgi:hypothetical protein
MQFVFAGFGKNQVNQPVNRDTDYRVARFFLGRMRFVYELDGIRVTEYVRYFRKLDRVFVKNFFSLIFVLCVIHKSIIQIYTYL